MTVQLPDKPQTRVSLGITPMSARVFLAGMPKVGKTTLLAQWAPQETLIIDTQGGTNLLDGEHFVVHIQNWSEFVSLVDQLVAGNHQFKTIGIDMIDDVWNFADAHYAGKDKALATATDDYSRSAKNAEGSFRNTVGKLLATNLGVWFLTHTKTVEESGLTRYVPKLEGRVLTYVQGAAQFVFLAESLGPKRVLHTAPSAKFEAGSRVPLPEPMELDARALYKAILVGLKGGEQAKENGAVAEQTNGAATKTKAGAK
jgi:hypothetical protein